jgi:hypothetical protein
MSTGQLMPDIDYKYPFVIGAVVLAVGWLLVFSLMTWFVLDPLKYALAAVARGSASLSPFGIVALVMGQLSLAQGSVVLAVISLGVALVITEWRTRAISIALSRSGWPHWTLLIATLLWLGHSYLAPGRLLMGDFGNHIALAALRLDAILNGRDPYWTNWQSLGQPISSFYSPTTFWPITWIALATRDATLATKLFLLIAHMLSGVAAYALVRRNGASRSAAFVGGLVYAGSFAHLHLILYRGTVPQALSIALLPAALLSLHEVLKSPRPISAAWFGLALSTAGLLVNYAPFGLVSGVMIAIYGTVLLTLSGNDWNKAWQLVTAASAGVALASVALVPAFIAGRDNASIDSGHLLSFALPDGMFWNHLLVWRAWRTNFGHDSTAYLGLVAIVLALCGLWSGIMRTGSRVQRINTLAAAAILILSLFVRGDYLRTIVFTLLGVSILASFGADLILTKLSRGHGPTIVIFLLLIDLASTSVQPLGRTDFGAVETAGAFLSRQEMPERTLEGRVESGRFIARRGGSAGLLQLFPSEFPVGGYTQLAGPAERFGELAGAMAESDLDHDGTLRPDTIALLCDLRVGRIVAVNRAQMGLPPAQSAIDEGLLGRVIVPPCGPPVLFAPGLGETRDIGELVAPPETETPTDPGSLDQSRTLLASIDARMQVDRKFGVARQFLVHNPGQPARITGTALDPITVRHYSVGSDRVSLTVSSDAPGFVRLSHAWFSRLAVTVNGHVSATMADVMGFIVVPVAAGDSAIEISPGSESGLAVGAAVSGVAAALLFVLWLATRRRQSLTMA